MNDLQKAFETLKAETFINVNGCLVEKTATGYKLFGQHCKTLPEVETVIANSQRHLNNSIK